MSNTAKEKKQFTSEQKTLLRRIALIVLAVVIAGGAVLSAFSIRNEHLRNKVFFLYSGNLYNEGVFPISMDLEAQKAEVKKHKHRGQTGKFQYYCTSVLQMPISDAEGAIYFGNVSTNDCALVFTLFDENDVALYRSVGVTPGHYVHSIRLSEYKPNGTYDCRLYVAAYDLQTNAYLGAQYSDMTLIIGG